MDDTVISMILRACELARRLEADLPNMAVSHQSATSLSESCNEIIRAFTAAREKLSGYQTATSAFDNQQDTGSGGLGAEEWLMRSGYAQGIIMDQHMVMQSQEQHELAARLVISNMLTAHNYQGAASIENMEVDRGGADHAAAVSSGSRTAVGGSGNFFAGQSSRSISRPRSRNEHKDGRWTVTVAAPRVGNTEIPPDDGFTWRKYGQKEILGSRFPRSYFRCTHQKLYNCPAKKQVQRLDHDPDTFQVTYRSEHTCHMSATAPGPSSVIIRSPYPELPMTTMTPGSSLVPPPAISQLQHSTTTPTTSWLSMGIGIGPSRPAASDPSPFSDLRAQHSYGGFGGDGYNYQPVMDMADTMFNSGSGGGGSMDQIFSPLAEDMKWDQVGDMKDEKHS